MESFYRATIKDSGEILEGDSFKLIYRFGMRHAKDLVRDDGYPVTVIELEHVTYSDYEYINGYGYPQRDIVDRQHIAYIAVSERGYTIDNGIGILDVDRVGWKSVQTGKEV